MATLTLTLMRSMIRDELNEQNTNVLTDTELNAILNDGYKDVCVKAFGYELTKTITKVTGEHIFAIPTTTARAFKVNYADHDADGLMRVDPRSIGFKPTVTVSSGNGTPASYIQWGDYFIIDPNSDTTATAATTYAYCSCFPAAVMSADGDTPASLPAEFHECVYEFGVCYACFKLGRWGEAGLKYNRYIGNVQQKRFEYQYKIADRRVARETPDSVTVEFKSA